MQLSKEFDIKSLRLAIEFLTQISMESERNVDFRYPIKIYQISINVFFHGKNNINKYSFLVSGFSLSSIEYLNIENVAKKMLIILHARAIDSIMYSMACARLDILYVVSVVNIYLTNLEKKLISSKIDAL